MSESQTWDAFAQLPDPWHVFYSVVWQSRRSGRQGDGEADFILLHPTKGALILEVKGGKRIEIEDGRWFSVSHYDKREPIKNPYEQGVASKHAFKRYLDEVLPLLPPMTISHAVAFPGWEVSGHLGMAGRREITLDRRDLTSPGKSVDGLLDHWESFANLSKDDIRSIVSHIAPTTTIQTRLRDEIDFATSRLIELTEEQQRVLMGMRRNRRAVIYGWAGTGKTILASHRARVLAEDGFGVLLTCFNRPLADALEREVVDVDGVSVQSFHQLCARQASLAGLDWSSGDADWWVNVAPEILMEAVEATGFSIDAVVVDEGQDFAASWFSALELLMRDPDAGPYYVFADAQQAIYREDWAPPDPSWFAWDLDTNCRNTLPIATRVAAVFGNEALTLGTDGPRPFFHEVASVEDAVDALVEEVERLTGVEGLESEQLVILTPDRAFVNELQAMAIGDHSLVGLGKTGVVAETIYRFKGLEADAVVLLLGDLSLTGDSQRSLAYIGMSRARAHLVVIGTKKQRKALSWPVR